MEYEALIINLEMLKEMGAENVEILGDSQLVFKLLTREYKYTSFALASYYAATKKLLEDFNQVSIEYVPRHKN